MPMRYSRPKVRVCTPTENKESVRILTDALREILDHSSTEGISSSTHGFRERFEAALAKAKKKSK